MVRDRPNEYLPGVNRAAREEPNAHRSHTNHLVGSAQRYGDDVLLWAVDEVVQEWYDITRALDPDTLWANPPARELKGSNE